MEKINNKKEDFENTKERFLAKLKDLRTRISSLRKEGKDPLIAEYLIRNISSKIDWAEHNSDPQDVVIIEDIFKQAIEELDEAENKNIINIKKDVESRANKIIPKEEKSDAEKLISGNDDVNDEGIILENSVNNNIQDGPADNMNDESLEPLEGDTVPDNEIKETEESVDNTSDADISENHIESVDEPIKLSETMKESDKITDEPEDVFKKKSEPKQVILEDYQKFFHLDFMSDLRSIKDLLDAIPNMPDDKFNYFMRNEDNDFSKWVWAVFGEEELSKKIKGVKDKQVLIEILESFFRGE